MAKKQHRNESGAQGQAKDKFFVSNALRIVEADYYAARVKEPRKTFKTKECIKQIRKQSARARSDMTAQTVANVRYLFEVAGVDRKEIASRFGLTYQRVVCLCEYQTWAEVMPSPEGLAL